MTPNQSSNDFQEQMRQAGVCKNRDSYNVPCDCCLSHREALSNMERLWQEQQTMRGTSCCPICGNNEPHSHSQDEIHEWLEVQAGRFGYDVLMSRKGPTEEPKSLRRIEQMQERITSLERQLEQAKLKEKS